jgi:ribosomal subunit interface protein
MHLTVKGKHIDVGDSFRGHAEESLNAIVAKYFDKPIEATVVLGKDTHHRFKADISVHVGRGILLQSEAEAEQAYAAFDAAADKIATRLRRHKRRLKGRHRDDSAVPATLPASQYILEALPDPHHDDADPAALPEASGQDVPVVVAEMATVIETLSVGEAVMRMDLADQPALLFRNGAHGGLNMVYRRPDGHVGWVDPRGISRTDP